MEKIRNKNIIDLSHFLKLEFCLSKSVILFSLFFVFSACMDDDAIRNFNRLSTKQNSGVFVINEGNFMYSNASLSIYNPGSNIILNDVFFNTNALPLGDVAQSMCIHDSLAYIVINNSGKIYIINKNTFNYVSKITGLNSPREIHFVNPAKAYITDLYSKTITIYDPMSNSIIGSIDIGNNNTDFNQHHAEMMVSVGAKVFTNCWTYDEQILVINSDNDQVEDSIKVGKQPNSMVLDKNQNLWVLSDGGFSGSSFGNEHASLTQINTSTHSIIKTFVFDDIAASPSDLQVNARGDSLFFIYGNWGTNLAHAGIHAVAIDATALPSTPIIAQQSGIFYALGLDRKRNELYISNAKDFSQNGEVYRFTSSGIAIDTFNVGINPGSFCFDN